jgi:hypothetical protein
MLETSKDAGVTSPLIVGDLANFLVTIYGKHAHDEARRRALRRFEANYQDVAEIWLAVCEELAKRKLSGTTALRSAE